MLRPTGVSVLAILYWIGATFFACMSLLSLVAAGVLSELLKRNNMEALAGIGVVLSVILFFFAIVAAVLGWAMWTLKDWARIVTIVVCGLRVLFGTVFLLWSLSHFNPFGLLGLLGIAINGVILWYLFQPHVKQAFGATSF